MSLRPVASSDSATPDTARVVPDGDYAHTCANGQGLSEGRAVGRALAKEFAHDAAAETCGIAGVQRALALSATGAKKLCDKRDPLPLALGDVLAAAEDEGAAAWAEELFDRCLNHLRGRTPVNDATLERLQRMTVRDAGAFADVLDKALADKRIDADEARTLLLVARQNRRRWDDVIAKLEQLVG